jgi:hypothetical protein
MKLALLLFATVALANPVANPLPDEPGMPAPDDLVARQASCTVRGVDNRQNVFLFPLSNSKSTNAKHYTRDREHALPTATVVVLT